MGAITVQWMQGFEDRMRFLAGEAATAEDLLASLWWKDVARVVPSNSQKELMAWFLRNVQLELAGPKGGNINFRDMLMSQTSFENQYVNTGLQLHRAQLLDLDGKGVEAAAEWATQIGQESQYWPQAAIAKTLVLGGESTSLCYDGHPYFDTDHPLNPYNSSAGTFANDFTSSASGNYPGACPIDESVSVDVALANMGKVWSYIRAIKNATGARPRNLKPVAILVPPRMAPRAVQLTSAKMIAQVAGTASYGAGGGGDVEALVNMLELGRPIVAPEIGANYTHTDPDTGASASGSNTTWYVVCEQAKRSQLGALTYVEREPFAVRYYTGDGGGTGVDAELDRKQIYEWHCQGRNTSGYGHPYLLFRVKAA